MIRALTLKIKTSAPCEIRKKFEPVFKIIDIQKILTPSISVYFTDSQTNWH
jgi:hypothetical protein